MAIAWMYRDDYARAGIRMLPTVDPKGDATFGQIVSMAGALIPISILPASIGMVGLRYFAGALILGVLLFAVSLWANRLRSTTRAKWLMHATVAHIPLLLGWMIFDKIVR
jgi:heme o synthase